MEQGGNWDSYLPLVEFTYNNSFHSSIRIASFEVLYGMRCMTLLSLYESGESAVFGHENVQRTSEKIKILQEKMKVSQSRQKSYHDKRRKALEFLEGDHVFLQAWFLGLVSQVGRHYDDSMRFLTGCRASPW